MADRYWVGGTGNWNATSTTNWSTSSGGSSGASAPTSSDNVIFDANSNTGTGAFTVTVTGTSSAPAVCNDFSTGGAGGALDGIMTLSMGATAQLDCYGSMTLPSSNLTWTGTTGCVLNFDATSTGKTVTTNGVSLTLTLINFDGVGGGWTLGSAITTTSGVAFLNGTFSTGNYNITCAQFNLTFNAAGTRTVSLGSSTVTITGATALTSQSNTSGLTFNANTSTITCSNASPTFNGSGLTYYNVTFSSTAGGSVTITGANTFSGTLSQASRSGTSFRTILFGADQTIGTLTLGATNTAIRRQMCLSTTIGVQRTLTVTTLTSTTDVDFRDIQAAGASVSSSNWNSAGTGRFGDCGGNGNKITFDTAKTVYWNLAAGGNWSDTAWATTTGSGAAVNANNFPLAQDTAIIQSDTATLASGNTITFDVNWNFGSVDMSARTSNAMTLATGAATATGIYGAFNVGSGVTITSTSGALFFAKQNGAQTFTYSPTAAFPKSITFNGPTGTFRINGNVTLDTAYTFTLTSGTLDLTNNGAGNYTLSTGLFSSVNTNTRAITFGTGNITLTGNNGIVWNTSTSTNFSYTGTPTVNATYSGSTGTRTFANGNTAGGSEASAISLNISAGTDIITFTSGVTNSFKNIDFTGFSGSHSSGSYAVYGNYKISSTMTWVSNTNTISFLAASGTQQITSSGVVIDQPITQNNSGATLQLQDNLTMGSTRTFTLTAGTLDLNNLTLSTGLFSSANSNTRSISFGTGNITITGNNATVFTFATATNFTYTGTPTLNFNYSGSTGTRTIFPPQAADGGTEANSMNYNITAGSDIVTLGSFRLIKNLTFSNFTGTFAASARTVYGNVTFIAGMFFDATGATTTFAASSGTQQLTSAGLTLDFPITQANSGATLQLQDNLTLGSTRTFTHTGGTLDLNAKTATISTFSSTGTGTRAITFNSGTLSISGTTTSAFTASGSGLTTSAGTGVGTISMTAATAKTFAGGGFTYAAKLNQGGAGALTITGSNSFNDITNTTQPATVTFTAGTTTSVSNFSLSGTAGNLITINSSTPGSQFTLAKV